MNPKERDIVIRTIYGEARGEGQPGWIAVAWVIRNRELTDSWWGKTPADICQKKAQFSCWEDKNAVKLKGLSIGAPIYADIGKIVDGVWDGHIADPTDGCTHYYSKAIRKKPPHWAEGREPHRQIGNHVFFKGVG